MTSDRHSTAQGPSTLVHAMQVLQVTAACGYRGACIDDYLDAIDLSRPTIYRLLKGLKQPTKRDDRDAVRTDRSPPRWQHRR